MAQLVEVARQHGGPAAVAGHAGQVGRAVRGARFAVELVGEFVQHDIVAIRPVGGAPLHVVPGQHHAAIAPGLAQQAVRRGRDDAARPHFIAPDDEFRGVDEDGVEFRVHLRLAIEQQQAGLAGDGVAHLVRDFQPAAADEFLLIQKLHDEAAQLRLQGRRHAAVDGNIRFQHGQPFGRQGLGQGPLQAPAGKPQRKDDGGHDEGDPQERVHAALPCSCRQGNDGNGSEAA